MGERGGGDFEKDQAEMFALERRKRMGKGPAIRPT